MVSMTTERPSLPRGPRAFALIGRGVEGGAKRRGAWPRRRRRSTGWGGGEAAVSVGGARAAAVGRARKMVRGARVA